MPLGERVFRCKACGLMIDRDLNAARSLASLVAGSSPETQNACGAEGAGQENGRVKPAAAKQEPLSRKLLGTATGNKRLCKGERNRLESSTTREQEPVFGCCRLCGKSFIKRGLSRHLIACHRHELLGGRDDNGAGHSLLLHVEGAYQPQYWLYLEVSPNADWIDLDMVLRRIWMECCGHLSDFEFPGRHWLGLANDRPTFPERAAAAGTIQEPGEDETDASTDPVATTPPGTRWRYHYDFGSTTTLNLKAVARLTAVPRGPSVRLLARNEPPDLRCVHCGGTATQICANCNWRGRGWLCTACAKRHRCGAESLLPLTNSPRTGVCAYSGPSIEP